MRKQKTESSQKEKAFATSVMSVISKCLRIFKKNESWVRIDFGEKCLYMTRYLRRGAEK